MTLYIQIDYFQRHATIELGASHTVATQPANHEECVIRIYLENTEHM